MKLIYEYDDPRTFLKDVYDSKKKKNPSFSVRSWSQSLGFPSTATLNLILNKKRKITKNHIHKVVRALSLDGFEADFFEALVDLSLQNSKEGRHYFQEKVDRLRKKSPVLKRLESFQYFSSPLVLLMSELVVLNKFEFDIEWIEDKLGGDFDRKDISGAIEILESLKIVEFDKNGKLVKNVKGLNYAHQSDMDEASFLYHDRVLSLVKERLGRHPTDRACRSSYFFNIESEKITGAIRTLLDFNRDFIERFEAKEGAGDDVYQLCFHFLPLTVSGKNHS